MRNSLDYLPHIIPTRKLIPRQSRAATRRYLYPQSSIFKLPHPSLSLSLTIILHASQPNSPRYTVALYTERIEAHLSRLQYIPVKSSSSYSSRFSFLTSKSCSSSLTIYTYNRVRQQPHGTRTHNSVATFRRVLIVSRMQRRRFSGPFRATIPEPAYSREIKKKMRRRKKMHVRASSAAAPF